MKRNTIQRTMIKNCVMNSCSHPTAEEIFYEVREQYPNISFSTVYRNLNDLAQSGEIKRIGVANMPDRFDCTLEPHGHFICERCGKTFDIHFSGNVDLGGISNNITDCQLVAKGICLECDKK